MKGHAQPGDRASQRLPATGEALGFILRLAGLQRALRGGGTAPESSLHRPLEPSHRCRPEPDIRARARRHSLPGALPRPSRWRDRDTVLSCRDAETHQGQDPTAAQREDRFHGSPTRRRSGSRQHRPRGGTRAFPADPGLRQRTSARIAAWNSPHWRRGPHFATGALSTVSRSRAAFPPSPGPNGPALWSVNGEEPLSPGEHTCSEVVGRTGGLPAAE